MNNKFKLTLGKVILIGFIIVVCVYMCIYFKFIKVKNEKNVNTNQNNYDVNVNDKNINSSNINGISTNNLNVNSLNTNNIGINELSVNYVNADNYKEIDSSGQTSNYDEKGEFLMPIEDVFTITGRGTIVTGKIERGTINLNNSIQIVGLNNKVITTTVVGIEAFNEQLNTASAGKNVGLLLKGISRDEVRRGQVIAKPNSIGAHNKFDAQIYILTQEQGGIKTAFGNNFESQIYLRTTDSNGTIILPAEIQQVNPGDAVNVTIKIEDSLAMEVGNVFSIRDAGRTIGKGVITKIY